MPDISKQSFVGKKIGDYTLYETYRHCDFSNCIAITGAFFAGKFYNCKFVGAKLLRCRFGAKAEFINCDFTNADFSGSAFACTSFEGCVFDFGTFKECTGLSSIDMDQHCRALSIKGAYPGYSASKGHHFLMSETPPKPSLTPPATETAGAIGYSEHEDIDEYDGYAMMWGAALGAMKPRDLKAVLIVSDKDELCMSLKGTNE